MGILNVGAGQAYRVFSAAVFASLEGDVIAVQAGTRVNAFATISKDIAIVATMSDPTTSSAGIDTSIRGGNSKAAQSGGTATFVTVSAAAVDLQNPVVVHG